MTSQRVERVKEFAKEHADNDKAWKIVSEMEDREIYDIVKQTQSPEGAIRKIARMIGSEHGARIDLPAPTRIQSMAEAERKLLALAGNEGAGQQPYDDAEHHVPAAADLRPTEGRRAVRGTSGHAGGHPHHEETTEEQIAAARKAEEEAKKPAPKSAAKADDKKSS